MTDPSKIFIVMQSTCRNARPGRGCSVARLQSCWGIVFVLNHASFTKITTVEPSLSSACRCSVSSCLSPHPPPPPPERNVVYLARHWYTLYSIRTWPCQHFWYHHHVQQKLVSKTALLATVGIGFKPPFANGWNWLQALFWQ
jgi:hypothetical protein